MMTTYLPSILLILITYATTFFKPYFFEAALSVNLTTMLVMTTIFMTVMQMLPATAYVKMIDIFLIFGQLYPFSEVVLLTIMEYHREGDGSGMTDVDDDLDIDSEEAKTGGLAVAASQILVDKLYWFRFTGENKYGIKKYHKSNILISEEKVLPGFVVLFFAAYGGISILFYFSE